MFSRLVGDRMPLAVHLRPGTFIVTTAIQAGTGSEASVRNHHTPLFDVRFGRPGRETGFLGILQYTVGVAYHRIGFHGVSTYVTTYIFENEHVRSFMLLYLAEE